MKKSCQSIFFSKRSHQAGTNTRNIICGTYVSTHLQWNNTQSRASQRAFPPEESGLNFEIPSCLYDSNNQHSAARLRAKCLEGWGESMGPICPSSVLVNMLERVGQSSVTPRHFTTSLSFTSSFIVLSKLLRTSSCTLTQSERRSSSEQNQKQCLKSKTHSSGWDPCISVIQSALKGEKNHCFLIFGDTFTLPLFLCRAFNHDFYGDCSIRLLSVGSTLKQKGREKREEYRDTIGLESLSVNSGPYLILTQVFDCH